MEEEEEEEEEEGDDDDDDDDDDDELRVGSRIDCLLFASALCPISSAQYTTRWNDPLLPSPSNVFASLPIPTVERGINAFHSAGCVVVPLR